ncbi:MAG: polyribonucleotide nucleotidyltransferase, partial [Thermoflexales bacterium]|nr:polyribonucleotide nucleotidyltransferase [Thermoflexales bacterium]
YAAGRIPGSFFRRESRPSEAAILVARLTDRPLRPLFPKDMRNDVQLIVTSLSSDGEHPVDMLSIVGSSAALLISDIPFGGPVGAARIGYVDDQFVVNPTYSQLAESKLDLRVAGTADAVLMVECGAKELPEELVLEALELAQRAMQPVIEAQNQMRAQLGKPKATYPSYTINTEVSQAVSKSLNGRITDILNRYFDKDARAEALDELEESVIVEVMEQLTAGQTDVMGGLLIDRVQVKGAFQDELKREIRGRILEGKRPDGRGLRDIRPLSCEVGLSPRTHGTGLFTRGETQVLSILALGTPRDAQELDGLAPDSSKRYMHHYNFPPYSVGETRMLRGASRREIGHGALAERALLPVLPSQEQFPYTIRVVSEVMSSNGSTSMASVCGSSLALMDGGVPIRAPVAGAAMGLIKEGERYAVLTDIQGLEDHLGDMDFKVAGTAKGITALQMDIKVKGISHAVMTEALADAHKARLSILEAMLAVLPEPRAELSPYAPRMLIIKIDPEKIGAVIGPGGKVIRGIQDELGVKIDIEDDGTVYIAAVDGASGEKARQRVEALTESATVGKIYTGKVVRTTDFGAFVEILPGVDGMVHISQLADYRVERVEDAARVGDEIMVMVTRIDAEGKIRLSRQAVLEGWTPEEALERDAKPSGGGRRPGGDRSRSGGGGSRFRDGGSNRSERRGPPRR